MDRLDRLDVICSTYNNYRRTFFVNQTSPKLDGGLVHSHLVLYMLHARGVTEV